MGILFSVYGPLAGRVSSLQERVDRRCGNLRSGVWEFDFLSTVPLLVASLHFKSGRVGGCGNFIFRLRSPSRSRLFTSKAGGSGVLDSAYCLSIAYLLPIYCLSYCLSIAYPMFYTILLVCAFKKRKSDNSLFLTRKDRMCVKNKIGNR